MEFQRKPTHPGEVLREDVLQPLGLSIAEAARRLKVHRKTLSSLLQGKTSLSPEMAVKIGKATRTTPESWLYMQAKLDIWNAQQSPADVEEFEQTFVI